MAAQGKISGMIEQSLLEAARIALAEHRDFQA